MESVGKRIAAQVLCLSVILAVLIALVNLGVAVSPARAQDKIKVVASFSILGDLVKNVGGDKLELSVLVGPDGDAHTFEPTPADNKKLAEAALIFENGFEFETWLDKIYAASGSKAKRVVVTTGIEPLPGDEHEHDQATATKEADHDEHGEHNPHAWHDVKAAIQMVKNIRDELVAGDEANADAYRANAEQYIKQLEDLDASIKKQVEALPKDSRKLVTTHDAFPYFANAYGFGIIGWALPTSTEAADPAAGKIAELIKKIKEAKVKAIFVENITDEKLMNQIAKEAGVIVAPPLYSDALGKPGTEGDTYVKMMGYNVKTIVSALR